MQVTAFEDNKARRGRPRLLDAAALLTYAMKALAARALSTSEVRTKLERRAETHSDVETVMAKLGEFGFLNDGKFAEHFAQVRKDSQGFGKMRVLNDLRTRRVPSDLAGDAVALAFSGTEEVDLVKAFLERKYRNTDLQAYLQDPKHLQSAFRRLRYAGFGAGPSITVLKRFAAAAEELEDMGSEDEE